jgi:AAA ATPase domain
MLPAVGLLAVTALFGRSAEFARLRGWLAEAVGGLPQVVVCSGEAGIGKTRLLEAVSDEAESGGAQVLWARSPALASAPPYWLWRQLFGTDAVTDPVPVTGPVTGARHTSWGTRFWLGGFAVLG